MKKQRVSADALHIDVLTERTSRSAAISALGAEIGTKETRYADDS